jgi:hypothetical protein
LRSLVSFQALLSLRRPPRPRRGSQSPERGGLRLLSLQTKSKTSPFLKTSFLAAPAPSTSRLAGYAACDAWLLRNGS